MERQPGGDGQSSGESWPIRLSAQRDNSEGEVGAKREKILILIDLRQAIALQPGQRVGTFDRWSCIGK